MSGHPGRHACFVSADPVAVRRVSGEFAWRGLQGGERVVWITEGGAFAEASAILRPRGISFDHAVGRGQLLVRTPEQCLFRDGVFDRFRALSFVQEQVERTREASASGLRIVQEIGAIRGAASNDARDLSAYEAGLNVIVARNPVEVLCVYHRRSIAPSLLLRGLDLHPLELGDDLEAEPNPFYQAWIELGGEGADSGVDGRLRFLDEIRALRRSGRNAGRGASHDILREIRHVGLRATSREEVLRGFLDILRHTSGALVGHALRVEPQSEALVSTRIWSPREPAGFDWLVAGRQKAKVRRGEGVAGRAWEQRSPAWTASRGTLAESGERTDVGTRIAVPVLTRGEVRAVLELFLGDGRDPDRDLMPALEDLGWLMGVVLAEFDQDPAYRAGGAGGDQPALRSAQAEARFLEVALRRTSEAVAITSGKFTGGGPSILYVNRAFTELTGYSEGEALGRSLRILTGPGTDAAQLRELREGLGQGRTASAEIVAYRKDGSEFLMRWELFPVTDPDGRIQNFVSIQRDVTSRRMTEEALQRANRDPLTGLLNREVFMRRLGRALERWHRRKDSPFAVLFLDLNGFKAINDKLGHVLGDQLLAQVARRLERTLRPGDTVARFGGDEFVILVEFVEDLRDPLAVAERVREQLHAPFVLRGQEARVEASIGVAFSHSGYTHAEEILRDADTAMYHAKENGGGYHVHDEDLAHAMVVSDRVRDELRTALDESRFRLHYQPFVDLDSGGIVGIEALLRWAHPEKGLVAPDEFLKAAEESGLMVPIGRWVLRSACEQLAAWKGRFQSAAPFVLSVNLSASEATDTTLVDELRVVLKETGADPRSLQLEFPEEVFAAHGDEAGAVLSGLVGLGVRICVDDFGLGHSTLAYLHQLPVGVLKLDRVFLSDVPNGDGGLDPERTVRAILRMAQELGVDVIAKGVETAGQRDVLKRLSCPYAQGYLFFDPVDLGGIEELLGARAVGNGNGRGNGNGHGNGNGAPRRRTAT